MSGDNNLQAQQENAQEQEVKGSVSIDPSTLSAAQESENLGAAILLSENAKE